MALCGTNGNADGKRDVEALESALKALEARISTQITDGDRRVSAEHKVEEGIGAWHLAHRDTPGRLYPHAGLVRKANDGAVDVEVFSGEAGNGVVGVFRRGIQDSHLIECCKPGCFTG